MGSESSFSSCEGTWRKAGVQIVKLIARERPSIFAAREKWISGFFFSLSDRLVLVHQRNLDQGGD